MFLVHFDGSNKPLNIGETSAVGLKISPVVT